MEILSDSLCILRGEGKGLQKMPLNLCKNEKKNNDNKKKYLGKRISLFII